MTRVHVVSERDNVATALDALEVGARVTIGDRTIAVLEPIGRGHKIALRAITAGEPIVKYGSPIGTAAADIPEGAHVHTHNLSSNRGRGDLASAAEDR
jgi:hypothetical protein